MVVRDHFLPLPLVEVEDRAQLLELQQELDVVRGVHPLLQLERPLEDLVYDSLRQVKHFRLFLVHQEVDVSGADFDATVEEVVPNVLRLYLLPHISVWQISYLLILLLTAEQLGIGILHEHHNICMIQLKKDVPIYANFLQGMQLEEVSEPEHILH